jgi:glycosyltransferase involved in cell wall biosynthesis
LVNDLGLKDDVALLGFTENPYAYIARSAVFVMSSIYEGLPTVLIEAMALGTPVVSTNCKSGPGEILDGGRYGFLVPVSDIQSIAEGILSVLSGNYKSVDSVWLDQFTLQNATRKYLDIIGISQ